MFRVQILEAQSNRAITAAELKRDEGERKQREENLMERNIEYQANSNDPENQFTVPRKASLADKLVISLASSGGLLGRAEFGK